MNPKDEHPNMPGWQQTSIQNAPMAVGIATPTKCEK